MNIEIKAIKDRGDPKEERLVLEANRDDDVGRYVVFAAPRSEDGSVSSELKRAYWFPDKPVSAGDLVILYTREGSPKKKKNADGSRSHFFYWGLEEPIWGEPGYFAVLLLVKSWKATETEAATR